ERDFQSKLVRRANELREVVEGAERRLDRGVSPVLVPDRPRTSDVVGLRARSVVLALAKRSSDGVNRRQVNDVEAKARDAGQFVNGVKEGPVFKCGPLATTRARRPCKDLAP